MEARKDDERNVMDRISAMFYFLALLLELYNEMKEIENWYGFHSFYLASNNISWAELGAFSFVPLSEFVGRPSWTKSGP